MRSLLYLDLSMLTVQVSQQHPLVALHLNKVNSFSAVTVHTTAAENVGPESRRVGRHKGHTRVIKSGDDGEVKVCWERSTHYVGKRVTGIVHGKEGRPQEIQDRQNEVPAKRADVRHV